MESQKRQPEPEDKGVERPGPGLPQSRAQVVVLTAMMHHMRSPEHSGSMAHSVEDIITQVFQEEEDEPGPPGHWNLEKLELIGKEEGSKNQRLRNEPEKDIPQSHRD